MLKLFNIEWIKIKNYRTFWILFGTFVILFPVGFFIFAYYFMQNFSAKASATMQEQVVKGMLGLPFNFPTVWQTSAWMGGLFFLIIGMLFIMLITNEIHYRTHRQNIIDGWSRMNFLNAKISLLVFFVLCTTLLVFVTALITGLVYDDGKTMNIFEGSYFILYYSLMATQYLVVAYFIAFLIKRTGLAIIIYFAFVCIVDNMLWGLLTLKGWQAGYFLPLEVVDSLVTNPFKPRMLEKREIADGWLIGAALFYLAGLAYFTIQYFKRIDLKT